MKRALKRTKWDAARALDTSEIAIHKERWQNRWTAPARLASAEGMILPTMLIVMLIVLTLGLSLSALVLAQLDRTSRGVVAANAMLTAEAGIEQSLFMLNEDPDFPGFNTETEFINNTNQGRTTYQTTVTNGSLDNEKIITATGRSYIDPDDEEAAVVRSARVIVVGTSTTENHAVRAGAGGLILTGSATISNGPVHVNGYIQMSGSARIGNSSNPVDVRVANIRCPVSAPYTSYPSLCPANMGNPITANVWSNRIYGDVCATHQTLTTPNFTSHSGVAEGCVAEELEMPPYDRQGQIDTVNSTYTSAQASCNGSTTATLPANLHVTGNLNTGGSCTLTITGDIWIDGNLNTGGASSIHISDAATESPVIMIDGSGGADIGASTRIIPNGSGIAATIITYHSDGSCSPDCTSLSGSELHSSRDNETITIRGAAQAPGSLFYARWSKVTVLGSGTTGGTIGQTVELRGAGNIVFGTELSSGSSIWSIKNYQQIFE
ncbi:MAG: hypothetical protein WD467_02560 [Candidatus Saccharimonadales bacterium]